jgi:tetratricopeptide (TPR) repeat protein
MTSTYYQPSGQVPPTALPIGLAFAMLALPTAWLYAWLTIHLHVVVNFFVAAGFMLWLLYIVHAATSRAKVRNARWAGRMALAIAVLAWFFQWAAWCALIIHERAAPVGEHVLQTFAGFALQPWTMVPFAGALAETGTLRIDGWALSGGWLYAVWLLELWMFVYIPPVWARIRADEPFCEASGTWAEKIEVPHKFAVIDNPDKAREVLECDPAQVRALLWNAAGEDSPAYAKATIYRCRNSDSYISVQNIIQKSRGSGKGETVTKPVVEFLRLPSIDPDALLSNWAAEPAASAPGHEDVADPNPPELVNAIAHLEAGRYTEALDGASPHVTSSESGLRTDARRLCALAFSRLGRWEEALHNWEALFEDEPTAHNALQVATSSAMVADVAKGGTWIEKAMSMNGISGELPHLLILTNFVTALTRAGQLEAVMPYLDKIRQAYIDVGRTDPTILYLHRMPLFDVFLNQSGAIVRSELNPEQGRNWYLAMLPHLDESGKAELTEWVASRFGDAPV